MKTTDRHSRRRTGLMDFLEGVPDPRVERTRAHKLIDILVIGVCCLLCGGEGFSDMETFGHARRRWLSGFLELPGGIPSHDTFGRVFSALPLEEIAAGLRPPDAPSDFHRTVDGDHGRIETRRCWCTSEVDWFEDKGKWAGLRSFGLVEAQREIDGKVSIERRPFVSSLPGDDAKRFLAAARDHWSVENSLHWTLDVTFREDDSRIRSKNAAANVAALRRLALNMLKSETSETKLSIRRRRLMAGWNDDYLRKVLGI